MESRIGNDSSEIFSLVISRRSLSERDSERSSDFRAWQVRQPEARIANAGSNSEIAALMPGPPCFAGDCPAALTAVRSLPPSPNQERETDQEDKQNRILVVPIE